MTRFHIPYAKRILGTMAAGAALIVFATPVMNVIEAVAAAGTIRACVTTNSGAIKIVGASESCKNNETLLEWNIMGPQGPAGP